MNYENISRFLGYTGPLVERVKTYSRTFRKWLEESPQLPDELTLPFMWSNIYECRINFSPFFFRELMRAYMEATQNSDKEAVSNSIENKIRVLRYVGQLAIPGAYLDDQIPLQEKLDFLEEFCGTATGIVYKKGYREDERVFQIKQLQDDEKRSLGTLIATLGEACERIYFGEQVIGFPSFGVETFPDDYILYQDFDLNLGSIGIPNLGRVSTAMRYPRGFYRLRTDLYDVHAFQHRTIGEAEWLNGRPHISTLSGAVVSVDGRQMTPDEMIKVTEQIMPIFQKVKDWSLSLSRFNLNMEYCSTQSRSIKNLRLLKGEEWRFPSDAKEALADNYIVDRLKKEWYLAYNVEVAAELTERSFSWLKDIIQH